jgi:hypothetical protein
MWGIAIDIGGYHKLLDNNQIYASDINVYDDVYLRLEIPFDLEKDEIECLLKGIALVKKHLTFEAKHLLLIIDEITFNPTDYQPEGLIAAIYGWIANHFDIKADPLEASFNKEAKKYFFTLPE